MGSAENQCFAPESVITGGYFGSGPMINGKSMFDSADTAGKAAASIQNEVQILVATNSVQKGLIEMLQERYRLHATTISALKEREAMHQATIASQRTRIEGAQKREDRIYSELTSENKALRATIATLEKMSADLAKRNRERESELKEEQARTIALTEKLSWTTASKAGDVYVQLLTKLGVTNWLDANKRIWDLQRKASAFDAMTVAAARFK